MQLYFSCLHSDPHLTALTTRQCRDHNDASGHELLGSYKLPGGQSRAQTFMHDSNKAAVCIYRYYRHVAAGSVTEITTVQVEFYGPQA